MKTWAFLCALLFTAGGTVVTLIGATRIVNALLDSGRDLTSGLLCLGLGLAALLFVLAPCLFFLDENRKARDLVTFLYENRQKLEGGSAISHEGIQITAETEFTRYESCVSFLLPWPWGLRLLSSYYAPGQRRRARALIISQLINIVYGWLGVWTLLWLVRAFVTNRSGGRRNGRAVISSRLWEFMHATWSAWRSGALASVYPSHAKAAAGECDDFIKASVGLAYPLLTEFFTAHPPIPEEFLIDFVVARDGPVMVMTCWRLWMWNRPNGKWVALYLADIADLKIRTGFNTVDVTVRLKNNTEDKYEMIAMAPSAKAFALAKQLCSGQGRVTIGSPAASP
ncbi:MAG TPA: hypothetical protein PKK06_05160 [Phycisphaerae bacterium]|nr:hypothetical protein [Phycisphaerae bacterium]